MTETGTTCEECGLSFLYDPKLHECRTGPRRLAGPWIDEIERLQGVRFVENR